MENISKESIEKKEKEQLHFNTLCPTSLYMMGLKGTSHKVGYRAKRKLEQIKINYLSMGRCKKERG